MLASLLLLAVALLFGAPWLRLLALLSAAGLAAWYGWWGPGADRLRPRRPLELARLALPDLCCVLLLALVTFLMLYPASAGLRPTTGDHPVHYAKAWQLLQLLQQGRLWAWSELWMGGHPVGYNYPIGGELWVLAVHSALLGFAELSESYGFAIWLMLLGYALAVYTLGARYLGRAAGLVAALMVLFEDGGFQVGGWRWVIGLGVWPAALSIAFGLLALSMAGQLRAPRSHGAMAAIALCTGFGVLCHPLQLIHLGMMYAVVLALFWLTERPRVAAGASLRLIGAALIGVLVAAFWLVPFTSAGEFHVREFMLWHSWEEFGRRLVAGRVITPFWSYTQILGLVGCAALLLTNRFSTLLVGLPVVLFLTVGARSFSEALNLQDISRFFNFIHYPRFGMLVLPYLGLCAGYAVFRVFRALFARWPRSASWASLRSRKALRLALVLVVLLPLSIPAAKTFVTQMFQRPLENLENRQDVASKGALVAWLKARARADGRFHRVALDASLSGLNQQADMVTLTRIPLWRDGAMPAVQFNNARGSSTPAALQAFNVRYVVSTGRLSHRADLRWIASAGRWQVHESRRWTDAPFQLERGASDVRVTHHDPNRVVLQLGSAAGGRLRFNKAWFSRWRAYKDGVPVPLKPVAVPGSQIRAVGLSDVSAGTYELRFEIGRWEYLGCALTGVGLLLIGLLVVLQLRRHA